MADQIILVDGHSILSRAFFGVPPLTTQEGLHTNAVYGFLNIVLKLYEEVRPKYLAVAFDRKAPTFRHKLYADYKGTRTPFPPEFHEQVDTIKKVLSAMNIPYFEQDGYEADDILGTIARISEQNGLDVTILSGDRDLLQLATEKTCIRIPKTTKDKTETFSYFASDVVAEYSVTPLEFIDMKAIMGDTSDNIIGVRGIGPKNAGSIISTFHSIENAYEHADEIKPPRIGNLFRENYEQVRANRLLTAICTEVPLDSYVPTEVNHETMFNSESYALFKRLEFKSFLASFENSRKTEAVWAPDLSIHEEYSEDALSSVISSFSSENAIGFSVLAEDNCAFGIAFADSTGHLTYLPLPLTADKQKECIDLLKMNLFARDNITVYTTDLKTICHFFDLDDPHPFSDVSIGAYLLNPLKSEYPYEELAAGYAHITMPSREELLGKAGISESLLMLYENCAKYACLMSASALLCGPIINSELDTTGMRELYENIELPTVICLARMEMEGVKVEKDFLINFSSMLAEKISDIEKSVYEEAGETFNINSPKQLGVILFEKLNLPGGKKTKSGYSTSADVLEKLQEDYPIVKNILEYRMLTKLQATYAEGLQKYIRADGRIHGTFNQTITATGRISSTDPNLQNIPTRTALGRELRKAFVAKDGCILVDADFSQIELRILAHMSGDETLIKAYHSATDIHTHTASEVFGVPMEEVTPEMRRNAKAVNFGIVYGISAFGLSEGLSISKKEAEAYIKKYFSVYPRIKEYLDELVQTTKDTGISTTMYGRRRPVLEIQSSNFMQRSFGERIAMNSPIQGTAADIMKIAVINTNKAIKDNGLSARIVLQVHDEIIVEAPVNEAERVQSLLKEAMTCAVSLDVPLEVEVQCGHSWYDAK